MRISDWSSDVCSSDLLDMPAIDQSPEQQLVGQGAPYGVLDKPLHRTGTHGRIEALFCQMVAQRLREHCLDPLLVQLVFTLHTELITHAPSAVPRSRSKAEQCINTITKPGRENPLNIALVLNTTC